MRDLAAPLLTPRVVSGLTGLSPQELRRWEAHGIPSPGKGRPGGRRRSPRLYSWRDVEQLQQATHLAKSRRVSRAAVKRLLAQNAGAELDRDWVVARPKPRTRSRRQGGVVAVRIPHSARRRPRRGRTASAR